MQPGELTWGNATLPKIYLHKNRRKKKKKD